MSVPAVSILTVGVTEADPEIVIPVPPDTLVTVPVAESVPVTVRVLPLLVTPTVPAPTINTSSWLDVPVSVNLTPADPFVEPTPVKS